MLDWRQDFAGELIVGDMYYDLAKLNHNLTINHEIVNKKLYNHSVDNCYILCNTTLIECKKVLKNLNNLLLDMPNIPHDSVPEGSSEEDNKIVSKHGEIISTNTLDHLEITKKYLIILDAIKASVPKFLNFLGAELNNK